MKKLFVIVLSLLVLLPAVTSFAANMSYRVGEGDLLLIKVYDMDDLTTRVRVDAEGQIGFPLLGQLNVDGSSIEQVRDRISTELADGYLVNPQVTVLVQEYRNNKIIIIGEVVRPGLYELQGKMSLLELISRAGGLTDDAGSHAHVWEQIGFNSPRCILTPLHRHLQMRLPCPAPLQPLCYTKTESIGSSEMPTPICWSVQSANRAVHERAPQSVRHLPQALHREAIFPD